jgi:23S rRNA (uridine2552-2'-O)-methyltransferase
VDFVVTQSKSSKQWLKEHFDDVYVKKSQAAGYRSRASFKLLEIQQKDRLIKPGMHVIDLGAAPGGWSQVAADLVGQEGRVIALDILPMDAIAGVQFIQGDFTEQAVYQSLVDALNNEPVDLVISDMAPNMSGMRDIDQSAAIYLAELALELAKTSLKHGASLLVKVFQGSGLEDFQQQLKTSFSTVKVRKPKASRPRSRENYLFANGFRGCS